VKIGCAIFHSSALCDPRAESIFYSEPQTIKTNGAFQYSETANHFEMINTIGMAVLGMFILGLVRSRHGRSRHGRSRHGRSRHGRSRLSRCAEISSLEVVCTVGLLLDFTKSIPP
jgi:hypothetical protein